ncbi:hypothetical protein cyc_07463 [Cyclospora cayetanensis]|uniref:Uncharacterized protein n=1 Tax=Cyclospora cayetanensis TaxID=88456 RepID=A0A1D3D095_9EIME|nr:hypothetical protein cyc_07463 [Cyclospora cayetanensis]
MKSEELPSGKEASATLVSAEAPGGGFAGGGPLEFDAAPAAVSLEQEGLKLQRPLEGGPLKEAAVADACRAGSSKTGMRGMHALPRKVLSASARSLKGPVWGALHPLRGPGGAAGSLHKARRVLESGGRGPPPTQEGPSASCVSVDPRGKDRVGESQLVEPCAGYVGKWLGKTQI